MPLPASIRKISDEIWEIPRSHRADMRVPARIYADEVLLKEIENDRSIEQLINVATLPGIQKYALAMPDMHEGYGFPIGGVAAFSAEDGIISPGGVGYDINCGVRLLRSSLVEGDVRLHLPALANQIFRDVPSGVGRGGRTKLSVSEMDQVLLRGAQFMVERGSGSQNDLDHSEESSSMPGADPSAVSDHAKKRGLDQLGTLGSGNHFLEIQVIDEIFDSAAASSFGLKQGCLAVAIHCGSRGIGHQIATDYIRLMIPKLAGWGIALPDRELACAPIGSPEGQKYYSAMAAAANFAWCNRHMIMEAVRAAWRRILEPALKNADLTLPLVYDVAHNVAKRETHVIDGRSVEVVMHRKGATRAFGPGRPEIPDAYRQIGQPVLIPGTMGTASYVLAGTEQGMEQAFGTSCHGAGRRMSRAAAKRTVSGPELRQKLESQGIVIRCDSARGLAEEAPEAYKDVDRVVRIVDRAGLARKVARLKPIAVIKGG